MLMEVWATLTPRRGTAQGCLSLVEVLEEGLQRCTMRERMVLYMTAKSVPSCMYAGASSPLADEVSFARRSPRRPRMAALRAAARSAAEDMVYSGRECRRGCRGRRWVWAPWLWNAGGKTRRVRALHFA